MQVTHLAAAVNVAITAAREAGRIIAQHIERLDRVKVSEKSSAEFVSEVDLMAEDKVLYILNQNYADHNFLAEESGLADNGSDYTWIVDPLDGTHNFVHGNPHCAVSIGLKYKSEYIAGVIFDPLRNEIFSAHKGGGAQLDGKRIRVSNTRQLRDSTLITGCVYSDPKLAAPWLKSFIHLLPRVRNIHKNGASTLDFAWLAAGRYDGLLVFGMKEWDIAAGKLILQEAGGLAADVYGKPMHDSYQIVAGNQRIFEKLEQLVRHSTRAAKT